MSNIYPLQSGGAGSIDALMLKKFSMEVMSAFELLETNEDLHTVQTLGKGQSVLQFPVVGRIDASYHTPGDRMQGQKTLQSERRLIVDRYIVSPIEIYKLDDKFCHFDYRSAYVKKMATAINLYYTNHIIQTAMLCAFDVSESAEFVNKQYEGATVGSTTLNEANVITATSGTEVSAASIDAPTADEILAYVNALMLRMDSRNIPEQGRVVLLKPLDFQTFRQAYSAAGAYQRTTSLKDSVAVRGSYGMNQFDFGGITIRKSYSLAQVTSSTYFTDMTKDQEVRRGRRYADSNATHTATGMNHTHPYYSSEMAKVKCVALTNDAVMTGRFESLETESDYEVREKTTFIVSSLGCAHGILHPDTAIVVKTA